MRPIASESCVVGLLPDLAGAAAVLHLEPGVAGRFDRRVQRSEVLGVQGRRDHGERDRRVDDGAVLGDVRRGVGGQRIGRGDHIRRPPTFVIAVLTAAAWSDTLPDVEWNTIEPESALFGEVAVQHVQAGRGLAARNGVVVDIGAAEERPEHEQPDDDDQPGTDHRPVMASGPPAETFQQRVHAHPPAPPLTPELDSTALAEALTTRHDRAHSVTES